MNDPLVLVFDVGTQSVRAVLLDKRGDIAALEREVYEQPYYSLRPNWAEQSPDYYFQRMCAVSRRLRERCPSAFSRVAWVTLTAFRDTTVCLEKDGRPLRDCILWMDQRQAEHPKPMPAAHRALFAAAGMSETIDMLQRTSACNWIYFLVLVPYFISGKAQMNFSISNILWEKTQCYIQIINRKEK